MSLGCQFTPEFIAAWKRLLHSLYGYGEYKECLKVPSVLPFSNTCSYLPLLSYTDLTYAEAQQLAAKLRPDRFQIRALDVEDTEFKKLDTVTMRLPLGSDIDNIWKHSLNAKARNQFRKAEKSGLTICHGTDKELVDAFYLLFSKTMHRHGTPVFSKKLFQLLPQYLDAYYVVAYKDDTPIAANVAVNDKHITWIPWSASDREFGSLCPNHLTYWHNIEKAASQGKLIFDFGRSDYGGQTYKFKSQWGAQPVKIKLIQDKEENIYSKYQLAASLWRKLPIEIANYLGPILCKRLVDL